MTFSVGAVVCWFIVIVMVWLDGWEIDSVRAGLRHLDLFCMC